MKKLLLLFTLLFVWGLTTNGQSISATYSAGDIETDRNFTSLPGASTCPGTLIVTIPVGATITSVDVAYDMTALASGNAWMSEQRSQLRCISAGGTNEATISNGSGTTAGTYSYTRTGLEIANGVVLGGDIVFELHAGRTYGGNGCGAAHNFVVNNTWTVTVHYDLPIDYNFSLTVPNGITVNAGSSHDYTVTISNIGLEDDIYDLEVDSDRGWTYAIYEADGIDVISELAVNAGESEDFIVRVTVPAGAAMDEEDTQSFSVTSQGDSDVTDIFEITTTALAQFYFGLTVPTGTGVQIGESHDYTVTINNIGWDGDTYNIVVDGEKGWTYAIYDADGVAVITDLEVDAGESESFIVRVTVPAGATAGDEDAQSFTVTSQGDNNITDDFEITTTALTRYTFDLVTPEGNSVVAGLSHDYSVTINNTGLEDDTYSIVVDGEKGWTYAIYDAAGDVVISELAVNIGESENFIVRVTVPEEAIMGDDDIQSFTVTSQGDSGVSDGFEITTTALSRYYFELTFPQGISVNAGESHDYFVTINNLGLEDDTYDIEIDSEKGWTYAIFDADGVSGISELQVDAGESEDFIVRVTVPAGAEMGDEDNQSFTVTSQEDGDLTDSFAINTTAVRPISVFPHFENFDDVTRPNFPPGWTTIQENLVGADILETSTEAKISNPNSARFRSTTDPSIILILITPEIEEDLNMLVVNLWARRGGVNCNLEVGTYSESGGFALFQTIALTANTWTEHSISFAGYEGSDSRIAFKLGRLGNYPVMYIDDVEIDLPQTAWTGTVDNDWHNADNWSGDLPAANMNVVIEETAHNPVITAPTATADLEIGIGAVLTIAPGGQLNVTGELTNNAGNAGLVIASDASGTGSLIHNTANVPATVERYFATSETWRLVSSPVVEQEISGDWTPPGTYPEGHGYDFYAYNEGTAVWLNQKNPVHNIDDFIPGKGYLVSFETAPRTPKFIHDLNHGNVEIAITRTGTVDKPGANLLGNPYASGIDWNLADRSLFEDDYAYVYDATANAGSGAYIEVNGAVADAFIASHQGFFVLKETGGSLNFTFTNAMQAHGGSFTKQQQMQKALVLRLSGNTYYDQTTLRIHENASFERDRQDARKFFSYNHQAPQFYCFTSDHVQVSINSIPAINEEAATQLGMRIPANGMYTIDIYDVTGGFENQEVYLEDLEMAVMHNLLDDGSYSFTAESGALNNRFLIHFGALSLDENKAITAANAYVYGNTLYIINAKGHTQIELYDIQGRLLQSKGFNATGIHRQPITLPSGIYVVRIMDAIGVKTTRIMVN